MMDERDFWRNVAVGDDHECWPWKGYRSKKGYGRAKAGFSLTHAHRLAYFYHNKVMPRVDEMVCHECDNPPCCNPRHLFLGNAAINNLDKMLKGRARTAPQRGERNHNARLSSADVAAIRARLARGERNTEIAADYPVTHSMVSRIRCGKAW